MKYITMRKVEYIKAMVFSSLLMISSFLILCFAFIENNNQIILGSELNANGTIEYMCLGNGCEDLNRFTWTD